jgi:protease II
VGGEAAGDEARVEPAYLRTNFAGGHGGSSGRYDRLKELAFEYAFMVDAVPARPAAVLMPPPAV